MKGGRRYLKDVIYGANDGIITTFAVVAGVAGADLSPLVVVLLGGANLIADGFSMAVSNYLGSKSEHDLIQKEYREKFTEVAQTPRHEQNEMKALLVEQGYAEGDAEDLSRLMFKNKEFFVDLMMHEELEVSSHSKNNMLQGAAATFGAFVLAGCIPLLPFFVLGGMVNLFWYSIVATMCALFLVGSLRSIVTKSPWFFAGAEMLVVGGVAAALAYAVGALLKMFVGVI